MKQESAWRYTLAHDEKPSEPLFPSWGCNMLMLGWVSSGWTADFEAPEPLVEAVLEQEPSLLAWAHRIEALQHEERGAGAWSDPVVSLEYSQVPTDSLSIDDHPMAGVQVKAQQRLQPLGLKGSEQERVRLGAQALEHSQQEAALQVRVATHRTWWLLTRTRQLAQITRAHIERTQEVSASVRAQYAVGRVGQHAVLRLEVLLHQLQDDLGDFENEEAVLLAGLRQWLGPGLDLRTPDQISPEPPPAHTDWLALAHQHRPQVARLKAEQEQIQQAQHSARLAGRTTPTVWGGYRLRNHDDGADLVSAGVMVPIPTSSHQQSSARQAALGGAGQALGQERVALDDQIQADVVAILSKWTRAHQKAVTYVDQLIPKAEATLETTQTDFSVGRSTFSALFDAEVTLLELERTRTRATIETQLQRVEALRVLGAFP